MTFSIPILITRSQVPGTDNQSYMPRPSYTCRLFPETKSMSYICNDDVSTSCNTHVYLPTTCLYPLNSRSSTDDKKSNNQKPIHFSTFSQDQSHRLGLGPTYAVSLSLDKIRYNFLQHVVQKVHSFVPKPNKKLRNDDDLSYKHARQAEGRGIAQTTESRVRYGTHTRLHVVLYTARVRMDDDTARRTSIFLGIYILRQPTGTRTTIRLTFLVSVVHIYRWTGQVSHTDIAE